MNKLEETAVGEEKRRFREVCVVNVFLGRLAGEGRQRVRSEWFILVHRLAICCQAACIDRFQNTIEQGVARATGATSPQSYERRPPPWRIARELHRVEHQPAFGLLKRNSERR